jgi:hypothetical protein
MTEVQIDRNPIGSLIADDYQEGHVAPVGLDQLSAGEDRDAVGIRQHTGHFMRDQGGTPWKSSKPVSSDSFGLIRIQAPVPLTERMPGGQPGHPPADRPLVPPEELRSSTNREPRPGRRCADSTWVVIQFVGRILMVVTTCQANRRARRSNDSQFEVRGGVSPFFPRSTEMFEANILNRRACPRILHELRGRSHHRVLEEGPSQTHASRHHTRHRPDPVEIYPPPRSQRTYFRRKCRP